ENEKAQRLEEIVAAKPQAEPPVSQPRREAALDKDQGAAKFEKFRKEADANSRMDQLSDSATAPAAPPATAANEPAAENKALAAAREREALWANALDAAHSSTAQSAGGRVAETPGEKQGGEGSNVSTVSSAVEARDEETEPVRLTVTAADGGTTP